MLVGFEEIRVNLEYELPKDEFMIVGEGRSGGIGAEASPWPRHTHSRPQGHSPKSNSIHFNVNLFLSLGVFLKIRIDTELSCNNNQPIIIE
jgi:hypothetical protein